MHTRLLTVNKGFLIRLSVSCAALAASPLAAAVLGLCILHAYAVLLPHTARQICRPCLFIGGSPILWHCSCGGYCRVSIAAGTWAGPLQ